MTIQQAIELAAQHHMAGRLLEAESLYQQVLQSEPNQPVALHLLGVIAHQEGKNEVAVELIGQALAINPDLAAAHSNLGLALHALGRLEEAIASYHKAQAINPDFSQAHYNLGLALHSTRKFEEAVVSYHKAVAITPGDAQVLTNLGHALHELGRLEDAVTSYRKALALNSEGAGVQTNLGQVLQKLGRWPEAIASYEAALAVNPAHAEARYNLGHALLELGRLEEAEANLQESLAHKPAFATIALNDKGKGKTDHPVAMIDKNIYQTFYTKELAVPVLDIIEQLRAANPEYRYQFFDDDDARAFINDNFDDDIRRAYGLLQIGAARADLWRYLVLYKHGGVYVDIDASINVPLKTLLRPEDTALFTREGNYGSFAQWTLMISKQHPILEKTIEAVVDNVFHSKETSGDRLTGPIVMSRIIEEHYKCLDLPQSLYDSEDHQINDLEGVTDRFFGVDYQGRCSFKHSAHRFLYRPYMRHTPWKVEQTFTPVVSR